MPKKPLKIAVESQWLFGNRTGVGNYLNGLLKSLQKIDKKNQYALIYFDFFLRRSHKKPININKKNFSFLTIKWFPGRVYRKMQKYNIVPPLDSMFGKRIYFFPNYIRSKLLVSKSVIVVYDLVYKEFPQYVEPANLKFLEHNLPESIEKTDHIVTISQASKDAIIKYFKVPEQKISVIYPAVDHNVYKPCKSDKINQVKKKYGIKSNYILFTSTLEPRKNVQGLLRAYRKLPKSTREGYSLVLVGNKGWLDEQIQEEIIEARKSGTVIVTGYVPDKNLPALYSGASVFVYPSFHEGFGIPPLEAMACKTPVITSDVYSLPEVVGDSAYYIDPNKIDTITDAIKEVLENEKLAKSLISKGYVQSKKFSWDNSAKKLIEVFEYVQSL